MEQRERISFNVLSKPASVSPASKNSLLLDSKRDVLYPLQLRFSAFLSCFRPAFLWASSTPLRFIQPSSDCSHIVRTPFVSSMHTPPLASSCRNIRARIARGWQKSRNEYSCQMERIHFGSSLCYFYEHLANPYPLFNFVSIFIFPLFRVIIWVDLYLSIIFVTFYNRCLYRKCIRKFIYKCYANVDVALEFSLVT